MGCCPLCRPRWALGQCREDRAPALCFCVYLNTVGRQLRLACLCMPCMYSCAAAQATALGFVRFHLEDADSMELAEALRVQGSVLVGAGTHFGIESHLRITHGLQPDYLDAGLRRISHVLRARSAA